MSRAELEKQILRLHKRGTGILKSAKRWASALARYSAYWWSSRALSTSASLKRRLPVSEMETAADNYGRLRFLRSEHPFSAPEIYQPP
jgi:hypothetical protein